MTLLFRTQFVLMAIGAYAYGDHVRDGRAFALRLAKLAVSR